MPAASGRFISSRSFTIPTAKKTLFKGTAHELAVPSGRSGKRGIRDAEDVIRRILDHPSTPVFICSKLIQRFVDDEINFRKPSEGPYAGLLARCIAAWNATTPKGNIRKVLETIFDSKEFWTGRTYRSKVKDPFEYIASTARALGAKTSGRRLVPHLRAIGMELFTRDDPDGWPEVGGEWVDTGSFQSRMVFALEITARRARGSDHYWDAASFLKTHRLDTAEKIVDFFGTVLYAGEMTAQDRSMVLDFLTTNQVGEKSPLRSDRRDFEPRVRQALGLLFSLPEWQFQ